MFLTRKGRSHTSECKCNWRGRACNTVANRNYFFYKVRGTRNLEDGTLSVTPFPKQQRVRRKCRYCRRGSVITVVADAVYVANDPAACARDTAAETISMPVINPAPPGFPKTMLNIAFFDVADVLLESKQIRNQRRCSCSMLLVSRSERFAHETFFKRKLAPERSKSEQHG
jgi:hypothetical protein